MIKNILLWQRILIEFFKMKKKSVEKEGIEVKNDNNRGKWFKWLIALGVVCLLINTVCIFYVCLNKGPGKISKAEKIEASFISTGLTIIGLALSVWGGLNVVNVLDKREVEKRFKELEEEIKKQQLQRLLEQNINDKNEFINCLILSEKNVFTQYLINEISRIEEKEDISYLQLIQIEKNYIGVKQSHRSEFVEDKNLQDKVRKGKDLISALLKKQNNSVIELYLKVRLADFNFYVGYTLRGVERQTAYLDAIAGFKEVASLIGILLPIYLNEDYNRRLTVKDPILSGYLCNSIGESYSKIVQIKDELSLGVDFTNEYGNNALFYLGYAVRFVTDCSTYYRNYGCAIERHYRGDKLPYNQLFAIYKRALELSCTDKNNYVVILSIYNKRLQMLLKLGSTNRLDDKITSNVYTEYWCKKDRLSQVYRYLNGLYKYSVEAKTLFPHEHIGYLYMGLYYITMGCISFWYDKAELQKPDAMYTVDHYIKLVEKELVFIKRLKANKEIINKIEKDLNDLVDVVG